MIEKVVTIENKKKFMIAYLKEDMKLSARKAKSLLKDGAVILNNKKAYGDSTVKDGDIVNILQKKDQRDNVIPQDMQLSILYEDEFLLAIDKPPFLSMYPTKDKSAKDTLANGIRHYFDLKKIGEPVRFYNRLDMNTSGIVLIPKDGYTHSLLYRLSSDTILKEYQAVVRGIPKNNLGLIEKPISNPKNETGKRYTDETGKKAITEYRIVETFSDYSLLDVVIKTGRTHQIRVHLTSIGHPIIGDCLYGEPTQFIKRQALHASMIEFAHPYKNERITVKSPLPKDIRLLIKLLKEESGIEV